VNVDEFSLTASWATPPASCVRDVAEIRFAAGGEVFTRIADFALKEERNFMRGSAVSLALWLADNWWRLRYESLPDGSPPTTNWRLRHELTSASGGTIWPPVMIHSTGERVMLTPAFARAVNLGSTRYILPEIKSITGKTFEEGLDKFFDQVLDACSHALDGASLEDLINTIRNERNDLETATWRRLEARLGYDPDTVPKSVMRALGDLENSVGLAAVDEAAAAMPGNRAAEILKDALEAAQHSDIVVDLSGATEIAPTLMQHGVTPPWQLGRAAARRLRDSIGLNDGPIRAKAFSELLQTRTEDLHRRGTARNLPYSSRLWHHGEKHKIALKSADQRDRRFELTCALADQIWIKSDFGVMSKAKTDRQKFQRAFAQNLLVPFAGLRNYIDIGNPTETQIQQAAEFYHVHQNVIKRVLVLEKVLPEETFEERLEAA
jgi:hypothetical protein